MHLIENIQNRLIIQFIRTKHTMCPLFDYFGIRIESLIRIRIFFFFLNKERCSHEQTGFVDNKFAKC